MNKEQTFKMPSSKDFIGDKNISDIIFGYLYLKSIPEEGKMIILDNVSSTHKALNISVPTVKKKIDYLEDRGYIKKEEKKLEVPYYSEKFANNCVIPRSTLEYLISSGLNNIIKVFITLTIFNNENGGGYFTYTTLLNRIGYHGENSNPGNKNIKNILSYLESNGLLKYSKDRKIGRNTVFRIIEINKTISKSQNREFEWKWKIDNIDTETIKKNNKRIYKEEDILYILNNLGFPQQGIFNWVEKQNPTKYNEAILLAIKYNLIGKVNPNRVVDLSEYKENMGV